MSRLLQLGLGLLLAICACGMARAAQVVLFADGRTMTVERVEQRDGMIVLILEGGGSIAVPPHRVANWSELGISPAERSGAPRRGNDSWRLRAGSFADAIGVAAQRHDVDPVLLTAMAEVESAFDPRAVSHKGALGLLQLMPQTAERFGVGDAFDASQNVEGGARYLRWLLERYEGRTELALAGYNAGEAAVDRYQGIPPYPETRAYVARVLESVSRLSTAGAAARGTGESRAPLSGSSASR